MRLPRHGIFCSLRYLRFSCTGVFLRVALGLRISRMAAPGHFLSEPKRISLHFARRHLDCALARRLRRLAYERREYTGPEYDGCIRPPDRVLEITAGSEYLSLRIYISGRDGEFSAHSDASQAYLVRRLHGARDVGCVIWIYGTCLPEVDPSFVASRGFLVLPHTERPAGDEELNAVLFYTESRITYIR